MENATGGAGPNRTLKHERLKRHWSQEDVADKLGVSVRAVSRWECGVARPRPSHCKKLCEIFELDSSSLGLNFADDGVASAEEMNDEGVASSTPIKLVPTLTFSVKTLASIGLSLPPSANRTKLVGRSQELATLTRQLRAHTPSPYIALHGLPGVGKTALALELAQAMHRQRRFPDGVLWAALGPTPDIHAILRAWGARLGLVEGEQSALITLTDWVLTLRFLLQERRMLLVLDDVWQIETARMFGVGGPHCATLITTRSRSLALSIAGAGAYAVRELSPDDGLALLAQLAPQVVATEREAMRNLVRSVGGLPIALSLFGNYLRTQHSPGQKRRLEEALQRVTKQGDRLRLPDVAPAAEQAPATREETGHSVATLIAMSDQALPLVAQQTLRCLSVFPAKPHSFSEAAALAVCDAPDAPETSRSNADERTAPHAALPQECARRLLQAPAEEALEVSSSGNSRRIREALDTLTDAGFLEPVDPDRYTLHPIIAEYACHPWTSHHRQAAERLALFMMAYLVEHATDYAAFDHEWHNIQAALHTTERYQMWSLFIQGVTTLAPYLLMRGDYATTKALLGKVRNLPRPENDNGNRNAAIQQARISLILGQLAVLEGASAQADAYVQQGLDLLGETSLGTTIASDAYDLLCELLACRGEAALHQGNYRDAKRYLEEGIRVADAHDDQRRLSAFQRELGEMLGDRGLFDQCESLLLEALRRARTVGDLETIAPCLQDIGTIAAKRGAYETSRRYFQEGLEVASRLRHRQRISAMLCNLGCVAIWQQRYDEADTFLQRSLKLARQIGNVVRLNNALQNLGMLARQRGHYAQATAFLQEALEIARDSRDYWLESETLIERGLLSLAQHDEAEAQVAFGRALTLGKQLKARELIAHAHNGLAHVAAARDDFVEARRQEMASLRLSRALHLKEAEEREQWLALLPQ